MDFKVKSKYGHLRDTSSLERVLKDHFNGATTIAEAIEVAKLNGPILPSSIPEIPIKESWPTKPLPKEVRLPYKETED